MHFESRNILFRKTYYNWNSNQLFIVRSYSFDISSTSVEIQHEIRKWSHSYHRVIYRIRTTCRWNQERLKLKREETQPLEGPTNLSRRINPIRSTKFSTTRPCKRRVDRENNTVAKRGWMYLDEIASSPLPLSAFTRDSYSPCDDGPPSFLLSFLFEHRETSLGYPSTKVLLSPWFQNCITFP